MLQMHLPMLGSTEEIFFSAESHTSDFYRLALTETAADVLRNRLNNLSANQRVMALVLAFIEGIRLY